MQILGGMFSKSLGRITINSITSNIINKELLLIQLYYYSLLSIKPKILQRIIQCSIEINDRRARPVGFQ